MKKALITTVALAVAALSGCASTSSYEPTAYKTNHSRAYNIAEAGGLVTGIQDASVPRDKLERLTDTKRLGSLRAVWLHVPSARNDRLARWLGQPCELGYRPQTAWRSQ